jgi:hypothetical protein
MEDQNPQKPGIINMFMHSVFNISYYLFVGGVCYEMIDELTFIWFLI